MKEPEEEHVFYDICRQVKIFKVDEDTYRLEMQKFRLFIGYFDTFELAYATYMKHYGINSLDFQKAKES